MNRIWFARQRWFPSDHCIDLTLDAPALPLSELLRINNELDYLMLPYTVTITSADG